MYLGYNPRCEIAMIPSSRPDAPTTSPKAMPIRELATRDTNQMEFETPLYREGGILIPSARSAADITVERWLVWQKSFTVLAA